jgi:hypothetical protein
LTAAAASWLTQSTGNTANVGAAHKARQQRRIVLDAAVVMQETALGALHQALQLRRLVGATPDIEDGQAAQVEPIRPTAVLALQRRPEPGLQGGKLLMKRRQLAFGPLACALGFVERA